MIPPEIRTKLCEICHISFSRDLRLSGKQWGLVRFCGRKCMGFSRQGIALTQSTRQKLSIAHIGQSTWNKGKHLDLKHKLNLSKALKGKTGWAKGKLLSKEHRQKLSVAQRGRKLSPTALASYTLKVARGVRHWNWQGGITPENRAIRRSYEYMQWRKHVFERDDFTCQSCGEKGKKLNADHELPFAHYPDLRLEILNGRTLCESCHRKTPTFGNRKH